MKVKKAVIPAAGLGTRFLPATKSEAEGDAPGRRQARHPVRGGRGGAGRDRGHPHHHGPGKRTIEDHFDRSLELENRLEQTGKFDELKQVRAISDLARIHYVRQPEPLGLGAAVALAEAHVSGEPFAVLLGDDIVVVGKPARRDDRRLRHVRAKRHRRAGGAALRDPPVRRGRPASSSPTTWSRATGVVEKPPRRRGALEPGRSCTATS